MKYISIILTSLFLLSFIKKDEKYREYHRAIGTLIAKIQILKDYQIDTINNTWTAKSENGFFSFEGPINDKNNITDYEITIKSIIYDSSYFNEEISIQLPFCIFRNNKTIDSSLLIINTATESFDDYLPFSIKEIEVAYKEKTIFMPCSEEIVFNRISFKETYIVIFKDKTIKKYHVDPISRKFYDDF